MTAPQRTLLLGSDAKDCDFTLDSGSCPIT